MSDTRRRRSLVVRALRGLGIALAAVVAVAFATGVVARFSDGPIGPFPGGPLVAGELVAAAPADWSFAAPLREIELEVNPEAPRSRTTWVAVVDGDLYVPCGFPAAKRWPHEALRDGRVVVRIQGRRYERQAVRENDPARLGRLGTEVQRKYGAGDAEAAVAGEKVWFFRLDPRPPA